MGCAYLQVADLVLQVRHAAHCCATGLQAEMVNSSGILFLREMHCILTAEACRRKQRMG